MLFHLLFYRIRINRNSFFLGHFGSKFNWKSIGGKEEKCINVVAHFFKLAHSLSKSTEKFVFFGSNKFSNFLLLGSKMRIVLFVCIDKSLGDPAQCKKVRI